MLETRKEIFNEVTDQKPRRHVRTHIAFYGKARRHGKDLVASALYEVNVTDTSRLAVAR